MTLRPVSHPQLGEIRLVGGVLAIGRNEEPFASKLGDSAARLSRRHARIFEEGGKFFVADLGSRNGTRINSRDVNGGPSVLMSNDVVTFGGEVSFKASIEHETAMDRTLMRPPAIRLHLTPSDPASGLETLVIEQFPFLVSRGGGTFEQYRDKLPDAVRKLSRRHAVIAQKGDGLYVEDLDSSNGTFIGGKRLDERARRLSDGDRIVFGSDEFAYTVRIEAQSQEATRIVGAPREEEKRPASASGAAPAAPKVNAPAAVKAAPPAAAPAANDAAHAAPDPGNRTRFVSSADSFLNVFCAEDMPEDDKAQGEVGETAKVESLSEPKRGVRAWLAKAAPAWRLAAGEGGVSRKVIWTSSVAVALIAAVGVGAYVVSMERRAIGSLLEEGDYAGSARAANTYLDDHADDYEASTWAEEALTRATLPTWIEHIESGRYADAEEYLLRQREQHRHIAGGVRMLDALIWAGDVEAHMAQRKGPSTPITLFRHEDEIKALVGAWEQDSFRRQQIMDQMVTREPAFEPIQRRVYTRLRTLRDDNALYVKAIDEFKISMSAALAKHDWTLMDKLLSDFAAEYPRVQGLDELRADLDNYRALVGVVENKDLPEIVRLSSTTQFTTPLVMERVDAWLVKSMPPAPVLASHEEAAREWRAGRGNEAIALLQPLTDGEWGEVAQRQIARYQEVQDDYDALVAARGGADYSDRLLTLWGSLRPNEDAHLMRALETDFTAQRDQLAVRLDASLQTIRTQWDAYRNAGGIPGVVRVEGRVSDRFAEQARRLSQAHAEVTSGARTYALLQMAPPDEWRALETDIVAEAQRQRRWIEDLNIVLEPALLRAKLDLLPESSSPRKEGSSWAPSTTAQEVD